MARLTGYGVVVRFSPIRGATSVKALNQKLWLPGLVNEMAISGDALFNDYDTIADGQFSTPGGGGIDARRLRTATFDTLILDFDASWLVATGQDPEWIRERLWKILNSKKPVHMLVSRRPPRYSSPDFSAGVTFRQLTETVRQGEADTRYMTLQWSEHRDATVARRLHNTTRRGIELPTTHRLTATDTLHSLSLKFYGDYGHWRGIRDANGIPMKFGAGQPIASLPGRFKVGAKIKIPTVTGGLSGGGGGGG